MKRLILLCLLIALTVIPVTNSWAQDDWTTYTSDDGSITFDYPTTWFAGVDPDPRPDQPHSFTLSNHEKFLTLPEDGSSYWDMAVEAGEVVIDIRWSEIEAEERDEISIFKDSPAFQHGFMIGIASIFTNLSFGDDAEAQVTEPIVLGDYEEITVNGQEMGISVYTYRGEAHLLVFSILDANGVLLTIEGTMPAGEFTQHHDTIVQILESVIYTPIQ